MSLKRTPPKLQQQKNKRNLQQISPLTPSSKILKMDSEEATVADMKIKDLMAMFATLATKEDIVKINDGMEVLQNENKNLNKKVQLLTERCDELERQAHDMYLWKNSGNFIVKMNKNTDANESKRRVVSTCASLADQSNVIQESSVAEIKTSDSRKHTFKVYMGDANLVRKIISNINRLQGSDISITRDMPRQMREQQSKLLMVRRFLKMKSSANPKVRDNIMIDGNMKFTWTVAEGLKVLSGESLDIALGRYNQTIQELENFLSTKRNQMDSRATIESRAQTENSSKRS